MPQWIATNRGHRAPDEDVLAAEVSRALHPFARKPGDLNSLRERLLDLMWDDVGVIRDATGLDRALARLSDLETELLETGSADDGRAFNLTWHDWLNLRSLIETSRVIALAAKRRENSRGAHFRGDFPEPGDLLTSRFTVARQQSGKLDIADEPVLFTRVRPGETLLETIAAE
jgi:fumarate reductase flavoprotein subunit